MSSQERLLKFIEMNIQDDCKKSSVGRACICPICDFHRIISSLKWYGDEARAINKNLNNNNALAVEASVTVLNFDNGRKSEI